MKAASESLNLSVVPQQPCDVDFGWYEEIRNQLLRRTVGQAGRVLDVGCQRGGVLLMLSEQIGEAIGVDVADEDLARAESERQARQVERSRTSLFVTEMPWTSLSRTPVSTSCSCWGMC